MRKVRAAVCGMAFCLMAISPASAVAIDLGVIKIGVGGGRGGGVGGGAGNGKGGKSYGVPGPLAGVGLPVVAAFGGYVWLRKRTRKTNG